MSHSSAVINAGFYTLQNKTSSNTKHSVMSQYCLNEKDIFERLLPVIPKVRNLSNYFKPYISIFL